ncbi:hypothetical protein KCV03_g10273, partial [Aureobasidium melanogenum]
MAAPTPHQQFIAQCQALYVQVNAFNTATPTLPISNALIQLQTIVNTYCNAINLPVQRRPIIHPHYISFPTLTNQNQYYTANPTSANIERPLNNTHAEFNTYITTTHPLPPTPGLLFCLISSLMTGGYHNPQTNWHTTALIFDPTPVLAPMPPTPAYIFNPGLAQSVPLAYNGLSTALPTPPTSIRATTSTPFQAPITLPLQVILQITLLVLILTPIKHNLLLLNLFHPSTSIPPIPIFLITYPFILTIFITIIIIVIIIIIIITS